MTVPIKILYRNILENSTVTVTTENTAFPKYRLHDRDIGKLFKGNSIPANFYINLSPSESLLHLNGTNGSTVITDEYGRAWVCQGTAQLTTTGQKFGTACLLLDGSSGFIRSNAFLDLGTGPWTIEGWFNLDVTSQVQTIFSFINTSNYVGVRLQFNNAGTKLELSVSSNGTSWNVASAVGGIKTSWVTGTWYKFAVVFTGAAYKVYIGTAGAATTEDISVTSSLTVCGDLGVNDFGCDAGAEFIDGKMDEIRITIGSARYAGVFVPESAELATVSPYSVDRLIIPAGHNLDGLLAKLQYSVDNFAGDINDASSWTQSGAGLIDRAFTAASKHYWRLNIAAPLIAPQLAEMFLSKLYTFQGNPDYGLGEGDRKNIFREETKSGRVRLVKLGEPRRWRQYSLTKIGTTQKADFETWDRLAEGIKAIYIEDHNGVLYFAELMGDLNFHQTHENRYSADIELLEAL